MKYLEYSSSSDRNAFANNLEKRMSEMTSIQTAIETQEYPQEFEAKQEYPVLQKYLDAPFHSTTDSDIKKIYATAAIIADKKGTLDFEIPKKAEEIAPVVSTSLTKTKLIYHTGTGNITAEDAIDKLIDHGVAVASRVIDKVVGKGLPIIVEKLGQMAEKKFPKVKYVTPILKKVAEHVAPKVADVINKGVKAIGESAKKIAHKAVEGVKKVGRKIFNFLFG